MEVITIESKAYKELIQKIEAISVYVKTLAPNQLEGWVDSHDICGFLNISTRTLQRLRSQGIINYSTIRGKTYYKLSEIERMMNDNLIKCNPQKFNELLDNYYKNAK